MLDTFARSLFRVALGALFPLHTNGFDGLCEMFLSSFLLSVSYPRPVFVFSSPRSLSPLVVHLSLMPASAPAVPLCDFSCPYGNELRHLVSYVVSFAVEPSSIYSSVYRPFPYSRRKPLPNSLVVVGIHWNIVSPCAYRNFDSKRVSHFGGGGFSKRGSDALYFSFSSLSFSPFLSLTKRARKQNTENEQWRSKVEYRAKKRSQG